MIDPMPMTDPKLSLRARGIWGIFMNAGRAMTAAEIYPLVPEGRDAVRKALRELIDSGYISEVSFRNLNGQWAYQLEVTQAWITRDGFSGTLLYGTASIANNLSTLVELTNVSSPNVSGVPPEKDTQEEYVEMSWPGFDDEPEVKRKKTPEPESGAVGNLDLTDRKERLKAKYKKTKFEAVPASMRRDERPEDEWTTEDLVAEFYELTRKVASGVPSQVNGKSLASWINQKVGEGIARKSVLKALRAFFNDPRLTRDPGVGSPLWRRFIAFYPTVHGIYSKETDVEYADVDFLAHQAKMAKLLED